MGRAKGEFKVCVQQQSFCKDQERVSDSGAGIRTIVLYRMSEEKKLFEG